MHNEVVRYNGFVKDYSHCATQRKQSHKTVVGCANQLFNDNQRCFAKKQYKNLKSANFMGHVQTEHKKQQENSKQE